MELFKHSACNDVLGVSESQQARGIVPLPICRGEDQGVPIVQSFWKPSQEELKALNEGHPVMLEIMGTTHAPLIVLVAMEKE